MTQERRPRFPYEIGRAATAAERQDAYRVRNAIEGGRVRVGLYLQPHARYALTAAADFYGATQSDIVCALLYDLLLDHNKRGPVLRGMVIHRREMQEQARFVKNERAREARALAANGEVAQPGRKRKKAETDPPMPVLDPRRKR